MTSKDNTDYKWYFRHTTGLISGPLTTRQIHELVKHDLLTSDAMAWHNGLTDWAPLNHVADLDTTPADSIATPPLPQSIPQHLVSSHNFKDDVPGKSLEKTGEILNIIGLLSCGFLCIPGIICGLIAYQESDGKRGKDAIIGGLLVVFVYVFLIFLWRAYDGDGRWQL